MARRKKSGKKPKHRIPRGGCIKIMTPGGPRTICKSKRTGKVTFARLGTKKKA